MRGITERRRQLREILGWTILSTVAALAKLVVWMDARLAHETDGTELAIDEDPR
jgi:hypothetical protein